MAAARSPLRWVGGKFLLSGRIAELMPAHNVYCEVFAGAAHVFFRKAPSRCELLNDINGELVNFWKELAGRPDDLVARAQWAIYSRQLFNEYRDVDAAALAGMTPCERAWRFFYLNRTSFGSKSLGPGGRPSFGVSRDGNGMPPTWPNLLAGAAARIRGAIIENLDWRQCVARHDGAGTLFYLDPPYLGYEKYYGTGVFAPEEFVEMADMLGGIRGKFLLSVSDVPEMREIFGAFPIVWSGQVKYSLNRDGPCGRGELVFANFRPAAQAAL